jgi:hypothetical protein
MAAVVAVTARLLFVVTDVVGAAVASLIAARRRPRPG